MASIISSDFIRRFLPRSCPADTSCHCLSFLEEMPQVKKPQNSPSTPTTRTRRTEVASSSGRDLTLSTPTAPNTQPL